MKGHACHTSPLFLFSFRMGGWGGGGGVGRVDGGGRRGMVARTKHFIAFLNSRESILYKLVVFHLHLKIHTFIYHKRKYIIQCLVRICFKLNLHLHSSGINYPNIQKNKMNNIFMYKLYGIQQHKTARFNAFRLRNFLLFFFGPAVSNYAISRYLGDNISTVVC